MQRFSYKDQGTPIRFHVYQENKRQWLVSGKLLFVGGLSTLLLGATTELITGQDAQAAVTSQATQQPTSATPANSALQGQQVALKPTNEAAAATDSITPAAASSGSSQAAVQASSAVPPAANSARTNTISSAASSTAPQTGATSTTPDTVTSSSTASVTSAPAAQAASQASTSTAAAPTAETSNIDYQTDPNDPSAVISGGTLAYIAGYTPYTDAGQGLALINAKDVTQGYWLPQPTDPGQDTIINYRADQQNAVVRYVDDTTQQTLASFSLSGGSDSTNAYSTANTLVRYKIAGYTVSDDQVPATGILFDHDDATDQLYTVHLAEKIVTITPENPGHPGQVVDSDNPAGPTWPTGTAETDLSQAITETIYFVNNEGKSLATAQTQQVTFTRQATFNEVTGKIVYLDWRATNGVTSFATKVAPTISGYTPSHSLVAAITDLTPASSDVVKTIVYTKNTNKSPQATPVTPANSITPATSTTINPDVTNNDKAVAISVKSNNNKNLTDSAPKQAALAAANLPQAAKTKVQRSTKPVALVNKTRQMSWLLNDTQQVYNFIFGNTAEKQETGTDYQAPTTKKVQPTRPGKTQVTPAKQHVAKKAQPKKRPQSLRADFVKPEPTLIIQHHPMPNDNADHSQLGLFFTSIAGTINFGQRAKTS
ncbi:mucin-binding protein [Loigolactobacillus iwatensis]|uniref:mucin-binding protein n=1 Tax=Loigolactobacillus iwatensis TaxID=1267156 RepID=UPI000F7D7C38|nr:hypothetical protein [Loigolactobacillus iwatensis]